MRSSLTTKTQLKFPNGTGIDDVVEDLGCFKSDDGRPRRKNCRRLLRWVAGLCIDASCQFAGVSWRFSRLTESGGRGRGRGREEVKEGRRKGRGGGGRRWGSGWDNGIVFGFGSVWIAGSRGGLGWEIGSMDDVGATLVWEVSDFGEG